MSTQHDGKLDARERIARFLWNIASEEIGGRSWEEARDNEHLKNCYRLAAEMTVSLLQIIIRNTK